MNIKKLLAIADCRHDSILATLEAAKEASRGTLTHKINARYFKAAKLARLVVNNNVARASDADSDYRAYDVERLKNINAFGDNDDWDPVTLRPINRNLLDGSPQLQKDVDRTYWCKGTWAGAYKAVKAWYRRNGGAGLVYDRGVVVGPSDPTARYVGQSGRWSVEVLVRGNASILIARYKLAFGLSLKVRTGYEIDNVFDHATNTQNWYPLDGELLRAPVTNSILLSKD